MRSRLLALEIVSAVLIRGRSLDTAIEEKQLSADVNASFVREMCYGVLRYYGHLSAIASGLLEKPLKKKDQDVFLLMLLGLYQLRHLAVPEHAVLNETVAVLTKIKKPWAKGLVNAVLRRYLRESAEIEKRLVDQFVSDYPAWLEKMIQLDWPQDYETILKKGNEKAPMVIRVCEQWISKAAYLQKLSDENIPAFFHPDVPTAIVLESACAVSSLPGFSKGWVSVQDASPQWAASLLAPSPGDEVLDACAAPGGKTLHLLQDYPGIRLVAVEKEEKRLQRIKENLQRANSACTLVLADVIEWAKTQSEGLFDCILLDAPCSGTGVIRRHPDIKFLRKAEDIESASHIQLRMVQALWPLLKKGGRLLYCTCSIMKKENSEVMSRALQSLNDAKEFSLDIPKALRQEVGYQLLPDQDYDGFYFACLRKNF